MKNDKFKSFPFRQREKFTLKPVTSNIYLDLTREFNTGRLRCILSSGQAVVLHRLAVVSNIQAQATNDYDANEYSHGVFASCAACCAE